MSNVAKSPLMGNEYLLEVRELVKHFPTAEGMLGRNVGSVRAVDGVSFALKKGETLGLVGESGCGKSTVARLLVRLLEPTSGQVVFKEQDVFTLERRKLMALRRRFQIIFQDPFGSLDPRMTVGAIVEEGLAIHQLGSARERKESVSDALQKVGLAPEHAGRYPHEFSGGQRQRIGIARALVLGPELIVADEPVSALDVSIQAQILNLMQDLQAELDLSYVFISHNLSVVEHISDRVAVMYCGKIIEIVSTQELYAAPLHPYSAALLSAVLDPELGRSRQRTVLEGEPPSPVKPPAGCRFHPRCPHKQNICEHEEPPLLEHRSDHFAACHYPLL